MKLPFSVEYIMEILTNGINHYSTKIY